MKVCCPKCGEEITIGEVACPIGLNHPDCGRNGCMFAKESLCDFPFVGGLKYEIKERMKV